MSLATESKTWRLKLRTILLAVSGAVLVLPVGGIYFLKLYENELVRRTELELISQAALISALYKREIEKLTAGESRPDYGTKITPPPDLEDYYKPYKAVLNLSASEIKPRPQEAQKTDLRADPVAIEAGNRLSPVLLEAQRTTLSGVRLLDDQGIAVAGRADIGLSFEHLDEVRRARLGFYASSIRERVIRRPTRALASISRGTGIRVFVAFPILNSDRLLGVVLLSRTPQSILEHLYDQRGKILILACIVGFLAVALVIFTSYTIARPLHALIQQTRRFASGESRLIEPLKHPVTEEVSRLSESFAEMASSLEYRAEYIRNFATQVSHEFKTPLTGIQGAIELLQEHMDEMGPEKRGRFLNNIAQDAHRLKLLVDRLLDMARADVAEPTGGKTEIAPIMAKLRERYQAQDLEISTAGEKEVVVAIPLDILETVLVNLLDNSRQNGAGSVAITLSQAANGWSLIVADDGKGITPANTEKVFTPFFTTRRDDGGTGLGLGIVRSLLRAYGGEISLDSTARGASFRITVPAAQ